MNKRFDDGDNYFDKMDHSLDRMDTQIEYIEKENDNNQRFAGPKLQAQQPRLAVRAGVLQDKKTRDRKKGVALVRPASAIQPSLQLPKKTSVTLRSTKAPECQSRASHLWR